MKKLGLIISSIFAIHFVRAAELGETLAGLDQSLVVLVALFLISFSLAFFSLSKVFKENKSMAGIISGAMAFLVIYGVNKIGFDTPDFFYNMGISESTFSLALFLIIIVGIVFMFIKLKKDALIIISVLLMGVSFFVYTKTLLLILGVILLIVWFFISVRKNKNGNQQKPNYSMTVGQSR